MLSSHLFLCLPCVLPPHVHFQNRLLLQRLIFSRFCFQYFREIPVTISRPAVSSVFLQWLLVAHDKSEHHSLTAWKGAFCVLLLLRSWSPAWPWILSSCQLQVSNTYRLLLICMLLLLFFLYGRTMWMEIERILVEKNKRKPEWLLICSLHTYSEGCRGQFALLSTEKQKTLRFYTCVMTCESV